jgi:hypothetical protein
LEKRLLQGAAVGAVATIFVGFSWGGWSLGSTADKMAKEQSEQSVVAALAPVCADKIRAAGVCFHSFSGVGVTVLSHEGNYRPLFAPGGP